MIEEKKQDDTVSVSSKTVSTPVEKHRTVREKKHKKVKSDRLGRQCEKNRGPVCHICFSKRFPETTSERVHKQDCCCFWCNLCKDELKRKGKINTNKVDLSELLPQKTKDSEAIINESNIVESINEIDSFDETITSEIFNYWDRFGFDLIAFSLFKINASEFKRTSKEFEISAKVKEGLQKKSELVKLLLGFKSNYNSISFHFSNIYEGNKSANVALDFLSVLLRKIIDATINRKSKDWLENQNLLSILNKWVKYKIMQVKCPFIETYRNAEQDMINK